MPNSDVTIDVKPIIEDLEWIRRSPGQHIQPVTPEELFRHLRSLARGYMLATHRLSFDGLIDAQTRANRNRGWRARSIGAYVEMREKGLSENEIIDELLNIDVEMWRIIAQSQDT